MKQKKWSSLDQKADARYAESLPSTGNFITGIPGEWEELPGMKLGEPITLFSFTPNVTSGWSETVQTLTRTAGW
jgi:hypothetical protein